MRTAKWWWYLLPGIPGLLLLAVAALLLLVDPDSFRPRIEAMAREATGRELELEGPLRWSLLPRIAISAGAGELRSPSAAPGAPPLLQWDELSFGARWLPLLRGRFELGRVRIQRPQLSLQIEADGRDNWQGAIEAAPGQPSAWSFALDAIEIRDGSVAYVDQREPQRFALTQLELTTAAWQGQGPLAFEASGRLAAADLRLDLQLATTAEFTADSVALTGTSLGIGTATLALRLDLPLATADLAAASYRASRAEAMVRGSDARLVLTGIELDLSGDAARGSTRLEGRTDSLRSLLQALGIEPPQTTDPDVLAAAEIGTGLELDGEALRATALQFSVDGYRIEGSLQRRMSDGLIEFELSAPAFDLGRYLEPDDAGSEPFRFPRDALRALPARGVLRIEKATLDDVVAKGVELRFETAEGPARGGARP